MSRFFAASSSESSGSSEDDLSELSGNESEVSQVYEKKSTASKWMKKSQEESSSDDENEQKVVKSQKDKRYDEMRGCVEKMLNSLKIKDWTSLLLEFDKLQKGLSKADAMVKREGIPRFYVRALTQLEDGMNLVAMDKDSIKKMNSSTAKAYNTMKQKIKKEAKVRGENMKKFRDDPVDELDSADEADEIAEKKAAEVAPSKKVTIQEPVREDLDGFTEVGKGGKFVEEMNIDVFEKLDIVAEARGKKNTDKLAQIETLMDLMKYAKTPFQKICVLHALVPTRFDYVPPVSGCMSTDMWKHALSEIKSLYDLLDQFPFITIGAGISDDDSLHTKDKLASAGTKVNIRGNVASFVDRLDDEFFKSLQAMDAHTTEYIERLRDETSLYGMIVRALKYAQSKDEPQDSLDLMLMRRVEHIYYKPVSVIKKIEETVYAEYPQLEDSSEDKDTLVEQLCNILSKANIDRIKTRSLLCRVYHLALHDQFNEAKNTLLMSHLQDNISQADVSTQTLFNRALVQIGLSAFRLGYFKEAHGILQEISSSGKTKELLAQGVSIQKYSERTPEQDKLDKSRQLPFHMHVNLELLECVYLVSAMLLEIPSIALHTHDSRRKVISKSFRRMLEYSERQIFNGPPENPRDNIMAASKAMGNGDWKKACDYIISIKVWNLLPSSEKIKGMLTSAIQEESLRTYIFQYSKHYDSFSIISLSSMFQLTEPKVKNIIAKMIFHEELLASLDAKEETVILDRYASHSNMTKMEYLATYYAEKISILADANDKLVEAKNLAAGVRVKSKKSQ